MEIPDVPKPLLQALTAAAAGQRCALVGGVVRDLLLHRHHEDPWRGLPDLDLLVEGRAADLVERLPEALRAVFAQPIPLRVQEHGSFGTLELELDLPEDQGGTWLLDIASARSERYLEPGENPLVSFGLLDEDLARRDFTVNAMALTLEGGELLDPHRGQQDLSSRQLRFLHPSSVSDDPTRLVRAARYAARLGFDLAPDAQVQAHATLSAWPWQWRPGDDPGQAPPALGTRLRMELELLLSREPWPTALAALQRWGALVLLDPQLQADQWRRRLHWAQRLQIPLLPALLAGASDPLALAERLQLPHRQHKLLAQMLELEHRLQSQSAEQAPSAWCQFLEAPGLSPEAVALLVASGTTNWKPLLRWWLRWRHVRSPLTANKLMREEGLRPGPELGERLRQLRFTALDR
ncbi:CCA tRNA nucleotidyltransferase [Synechococcus sp. NB0720_010]|uniref:CCA tRNA nucleotidyltransferase n=1 Tax=Synechococcus sp. NB0720_010 TaxID=2907159 RepID=UPI001FF95DD4|nr:CCA tRNA nucleotidyltransferase [Synechococcus sp. NB0720_010]UPH89185.1 CCA tRNA nucleotidyltransferase [Synechococcus sp. NB0720_010]